MAQRVTGFHFLHPRAPRRRRSRVMLLTGSLFLLAAGLRTPFALANDTAQTLERLRTDVRETAVRAEALRIPISAKKTSTLVTSVRSGDFSRLVGHLRLYWNRIHRPPPEKR